ncbi:MAG: EAL domain-containing protein [Rhodobacteraceae bacterium]|nr:EAL domain-containing protein [Paracoccaceae bacterium]
MSSGKFDPKSAVEPGQDSPLSAAVTQRDRDTITMVRHALARHDVMLAFQPVVQCMENGKVAFYEGLIRVLDQSGRVIPARDFIEVVETNELGRQIDCLALEMGLIALAEAPGLRLAINMSARSIGYPRWLRTLNRGLARDPTIAERLILEITESSAMVMPDIVSVFMKDLQARGIAFALDDFGAGYTAFRYLREFYFDILKIDGQFIRGISDNPDNQVLTAALISIAQHFDMFSVAENVENAQDAAWLAAAGIDCMQGYAFGAPSLVPPWREGREKRRA